MDAWFRSFVRINTSIHSLTEPIKQLHRFSTFYPQLFYTDFPPDFHKISINKG